MRHRLAALLSALSLLSLGASWSLTVNTGDNWCGARRTYFSRSAQNDCYTFSSDVAANVHSLSWCTSRLLERCVITFHSDVQCMGTLLKTKNPGSWVGGPQGDVFLWETGHVTNEVKAKSFMVQGCLNLKVPTGLMDCYKPGEAPWETARWCTPKKRGEALGNETDEAELEERKLEEVKVVEIRRFAA
jgi:hypothetical protein